MGLLRDGGVGVKQAARHAREDGHPGPAVFLDSRLRGNDVR